MKRMQTVLAVLSVAIGVAAFGAVVIMREWQQQQIRDLAVDFAPNVLVVRFAPQPGFVIESGQDYGITSEEAMALADLPGVEEVAYIGGSTTRLGNNVRITRIPVTAHLFDVLGLELAAGRAIEEHDAIIGLPVTVLGSVIAQELFGSAEAAIGELLDTGGGSTFRVVGVLAPVPEQVGEFERLNVAALQPNSPALAAFGSDSRPADSQAYVKFEPGRESEALHNVREAIARLPIAEATEVVGADEWLGNQAVFRNEVADELGRGSTWIVVLAVMATIGNLANALGLRAVDRAKVLAVSRAIGATATQAAARVVLDGLVVGGVGTAIGLALVPLATRLVGSGEAVAPITASTLAYAGGCGLLVSLLATLLPALWTVRMPIYRALREQLSPPVWDGIALTGMAAGALALVVAFAIGSGTTDWFQNRLREIGGDRLVVSTAILGARTSVFSPPPLDSADAAAIASLPGVARLVVSTVENTSLVTGDDSAENTVPVAGYRVDPGFFEIFPRPLLAGRVPENGSETVIGPAIAELAFPGTPPADVVGRNLRLGAAATTGAPPNATEVRVVGVYASQPVVSIGDLYDSVIVRLRDPQAPIGSALVTDFHIVVDPRAEQAQVQSAIAKTLDERYGDGYAPAVVHEPAGDLGAARSAMTNVAKAWRTIAWLSFLIGGAGLATIVSVRLLRSRPEHALKRALGATSARVATESTVTALRISAASALVGISVAIGVCYWIAALAPWEFAVPLVPTLVALGVSLAVGLAAAVLPIAASSRFSPWSVLRGE